MENRVLSESFKKIEFQLKIPKIMVSDIHFLFENFNRPIDEIISDFIVSEMECLSSHPEDYILGMIEEYGYLKYIKKGLRLYFQGEQNIKEKIKNQNIEYEVLNITVSLPDKLIKELIFLSRFLNVKREVLLNHFTINHLDYAYSNPEILLTYLNKSKTLSNNLKEEIKVYNEWKNKNDDKDRKKAEIKIMAI